MSTTIRTTLNLGDTVRSDTRIEFAVFPPEHPLVQALPPAIPASPTLAERVFCRCIPIVDKETDSVSEGFEPSHGPWVHPSTITYGGSRTATQLLLYLSDIYSADKTARNL